MSSRPSASRTLGSIRDDLERIDRSIVLLVAARIEAACAAIQVRTEQGEPVTNPTQEARVLARAEEWALELGVSPVVAKAIFRAIVHAGKARFEASRTAHLPAVAVRRSARSTREGVHHPAEKDRLRASAPATP